MHTKGLPLVHTVKKDFRFRHMSLFKTKNVGVSLLAAEDRS
jgi:hypothetical protein